MAKKAPAKKETAKKAEVKKGLAKKAAVAKKETPRKEAAKETVVEAAVEKPKKEKAPKPPKPPKITKAQAAADKLASEDNKKWHDLKDKYGSEKAANYSMSAVFEANTPVQHKVLGWGFIQSVQNDRLEVLFETGPKMLISNYKAK